MLGLLAGPACAPRAKVPVAVVSGSGATQVAGGSEPVAGMPASAPPSAAGAVAVPTAGARASEAGQTGSAPPPPAADGGAGSLSPSLPALGACSLPTNPDPAAARALYAKWQADLLTADGAGGFLRVRRPNSGTQLNSSNSEGIAYGMLIAVYLDDQATFDALWQYEQLHLGKNGLMDWEISPSGGLLGSGAASDGDEDMAFALLMADARWHGHGSLADSYANLAKKQIDLIWRFEVDHTRGDVLMAGDQFDGATVINISYFAPAYYRAFGRATGNTAEWGRVVEASYRVIAATLNASNGNANNGLIPAWSTPDGVPMAPPGSGHPTHHQLDSCRTPFRIGQDYCWSGEARALAYLEKIDAFYGQVGVRQLVDGYQLDGSVFEGANLHLAAFVAGAGVAAMARNSSYAARDAAYDEIVAWGPLLGGSLYYNESWSVLGLLMLTGQFRDLTAP
jgi:endo-1,4-beta-D-glucanase Y